MRKLIASIFLSVDGYVSGPNEDMGWVMNNFNDEMGRYAGALQASMGGIVLGRRTYEIMTGFWPTAGSAVPGANEMNSNSKYVFSNTLRNVEWGKWGNANLLSNNMEREISNLKLQSGKDLVIYGSPSIVRRLMQLGLIDEYHLLVHPVVLGSGKRLFADGEKSVSLRLIRTEAFKNGVVILYYAPAA